MATYDYDPEKNVINVFPSETLTVFEIESYVSQLSEDQSLQRGFVEIVHFGKVKDFQWSHKDGNRIRSLFETLQNDKGYAGSILVTENDYQYGMARMISMICEEYLNIKVIRSSDRIEEELSKMRG